MASNGCIHEKEKNLPNNTFGINVCKDANKIFHKFMNYTGKTRSKALKSDKYNNLRESWKSKDNNGQLKITLKTLEKKLSLLNSKECNYEEFMKYVVRKIDYNNTAKKYYDTTYLQKLRWYTYLNKNKHENELLNQIQNEFGKELIIIIGDWSGHGRIKYKSMPNIALKRKLAERFEVYLLDEYLTSKIHYKHHVRCDNMYAMNKKIHSVLTFKIVNQVNECEKRMQGCINRDKNSVLNYEQIINNYIKTNKRPDIYSRSNNQVDQKDNLSEAKGTHRGSQTVSKKLKVRQSKTKTV